MASAAKKIVVCGGNGFLGSRICKYAVARGWDVTSISRSGEPHWSSVSPSPSPPSWSHKVSWERADILKPASYTALLQGANYVVHSTGILLEADYKGIISGRESPLSALKRAFSSTTPSSSSSSSPNPLDRKPGEDLGPPPGTGQQPTYELLNRDSAILLARHAAGAGAQAFGYVSAAGGAPVLPARYIGTKREAEAAIAREFPRMRSVFARPPFLYDGAARPLTVPLAAGAAAGALLNGITGGVLGGFLGSAGVKPLRVDLVAQALVEALEDEGVSGPVEVPELEALAGRAWRRTML